MDLRGLDREYRCDDSGGTAERHAVFPRQDHRRSDLADCRLRQIDGRQGAERSGAVAQRFDVEPALGKPAWLGFRAAWRPDAEEGLRDDPAPALDVPTVRSFGRLPRLAVG